MFILVGFLVGSIAAFVFQSYYLNKARDKAYIKKLDEIILGEKIVAVYPCDLYFQYEKTNSYEMIYDFSIYDQTGKIFLTIRQPMCSTEDYLKMVKEWMKEDGMDFDEYFNQFGYNFQCLTNAFVMKKKNGTLAWYAPGKEEGDMICN